MGGKVVDIIKEGDLNPSDDRPVAPLPEPAAPDVPEPEVVDKIAPIGPSAPGGGILGPIGPQVVVYGPDGTAYPNPMAAEAAGVFDYTMSRPSPPPPQVVNPMAGPATIKFPDFVTNSVVLPEEGYKYVGAGSDPANIQPIQPTPMPMQSPFVRPEVGLPSLLNSGVFQRPEQTQQTPFVNSGGSPITPEQAQEFARMAAMRGGIGSL